MPLPVVIESLSACEVQNDVKNAAFRGLLSPYVRLYKVDAENTYLVTVSVKLKHESMNSFMSGLGNLSECHTCYIQFAGMDLGGDEFLEWKKGQGFTMIDAERAQKLKINELKLRKEEVREVKFVQTFRREVTVRTSQNSTGFLPSPRNWSAEQAVDAPHVLVVNPPR